MSTATLSPDDDRDDIQKQLKDDETRLLPQLPKHVRCPNCDCWNYPDATHCIFCGRNFDNRCPSCGQ